MSLFTAIFVVVACLVASLFFCWTVLEDMHQDFRIFLIYKKTTCVIQDKRLLTFFGSDSSDTYRAEFEYSYVVKGRHYWKRGFDNTTYSSNLRTRCEYELRQYEVGKEYPCWYDPDRPNEAVLKKRISLGYIFAPIPFLIVYVFFASFRDWVKSLFAGRWRQQQSLNCPLYAPLPSKLSRRGSVLTSLLSEESGKGALIAGVMGLICWLYWAVQVLWILPITLYHGFFGFDILIEIALLGYIGYLLIPWIIEKWKTRYGSQRFDLEISEQVLWPGCSFELMLLQHGWLRPTSVCANLVCEEEVICTTKDNEMGMATERIFTGKLIEDRAKVIAFTHKARVRFPGWAMHSFKGGNNTIQWSIEVIIDYGQAEPIIRKFPIPVYPAGLQEGVIA